MACNEDYHENTREECCCCGQEMCWECCGNKGHLAQNYLSGERSDGEGPATVWMTCPNPRCMEVNYY